MVTVSQKCCKRHSEGGARPNDDWSYGPRRRPLDLSRYKRRGPRNVLAND
eukprot:CAMPEP_0185591636 /NCGR_PEP_ID=MMETSP0434-20130131/65176_1 /TAXON_ID=626734 ORGANISM="Favella taraikaensis, Strain Fe Narragansett Bay" /NCGR_SAMPLE_ID=MMETSP0434 /ASSEMBLY_ACC=CAM_ASM_000379 /LENGTH=49 /DNA_ID=CAMNT_0028216801 /DNA_START=403 /DNA_END=552 /DNA_ORIENTATION=-